MVFLGFGRPSTSSTYALSCRPGVWLSQTGINPSISKEVNVGVVANTCVGTSKGAVVVPRLAFCAAERSQERGEIVAWAEVSLDRVLSTCAGPLHCTVVMS